MNSMMNKWRVLTLAAVLVPGLGMNGASAADKGKAYFKGKTVEWIVASAPGGGHDFWGRLVSATMQGYLPGSQFVVKNRPGAGHVIGANLIYNAKPNGRTLGNFTTGLIYSSLQNTKGIRFDLAKMSWLGKVSSERRVLSVAANSSMKTFADVLNSKRVLKFSASGVGSNTFTESFLIGTAFNIPFRIITGYSSAQAALALMRTELDVLIGGEDSAQSYVRAGHLKTVMMIGGSGPGIVNGADLAKTPLAKSVVKLMGSLGQLSRIMGGPPNIPADRLKALRTAFNQSMSDKQLRALAKRAERGMEPATGEEVHKTVISLMNQPPEVSEMLKKLATVKIDLITHTGPVTKTKRGGRQIFIKRAGQEVFAKVSGSRTKVTVNGKNAKRKAIKVGMTCTFKYPRPNAEATNVDCK
jgi:tripartite-type tricarboxylate transporter receptor subunit TctC